MTPDELGLVARLKCQQIDFTDPDAGNVIRLVNDTDADMLLAILAERDALRHTHEFMAVVLGAEDKAVAG